MARARIRIAFVDTSHHHFTGVSREAAECPTVDVVGVYTVDPVQREAQRAQYAFTFFDSLDELYDKGKPHAVITCADNLHGADVVAWAAERGLPVMKEKPMASSLKVADQMLTTANRHGVPLMVNWSTNWRSSTHLAKKLVDEGRIGQVWQVHNRSGHGGPPPDYLRQEPSRRIGWEWLVDRERNGAGAYVDFCSYGAVLSRWIMGQPSRVSAVGGRYLKDFFTVDDNAVLIMAYPRGHSIAEGTWTQPAVPVSVPTMIYGSKGAIAITGQDEVQVATLGEDRKPKVEVLKAEPLPEHYKSGSAYFSHCLLNEKPFEGIVNAELSRDTQEVLEAGLISMRLGKEISLPLKAFLE